MGKVFDWDKAATILRDTCAVEAEAGLFEDWGDTSGLILRNSKPIPFHKTYTWLASFHATPALKVGDKIYMCWREKSECHWHAKTRWPESALAILGREMEPD